jgi:hypothetical protein
MDSNQVPLDHLIDVGDAGCPLHLVEGLLEEGILLSLAVLFSVQYVLV